ncbi:hypothetical protein ABDF71_21935 [Ochrobactrum sp. WV_118_8]
MTDSKLVAIHTVEVGPQNARELIGPGKDIPAHIHIDVDLEAELVRAGAIKRVPVASPVSSEVSEVEVVEDRRERFPRRASRFKKSF